MFVVTWEPKTGRGGGHQLALDLRKAKHLHWRLRHALPDAEVKILTAEAHAAAAVLERQQRLARSRSEHR
jgi:hypothetical protein